MEPGIEELRGRVRLVVAVVAATIVSLAANQLAVGQTRCCCPSAAACRVRMVKRSHQFSVVVRVETVYSGLDADGEIVFTVTGTGSIATSARVLIRGEEISDSATRPIDHLTTESDPIHKAMVG